MVDINMNGRVFQDIGYEYEWMLQDGGYEYEWRSVLGR